MKIVSATNKANYRHIPLLGWDSVVSALNTFARGLAKESWATTDHQIEAINQSQGAFGLGVYFLGASHLTANPSSFVDELLVKAHNTLKTGDRWSRSYDYDGVGVFFKTTVEIGFLDRDKEMYYLSIHAAYVGDAPEEGLAERLGVPRALTGTSVVVEVKPTSETTFAFDFDKILYALKDVINVGKLTGKYITSIWMNTTRDKHSGSPSTVLFRDGEIEVVLSPGRIEDRWKWENGNTTDTWQSKGATLYGLLDESYDDEKDYDEPTLVISVRRHSQDRFNRKPFYLPEEKEAVLDLTQHIADALR